MNSSSLVLLLIALVLGHDSGAESLARRCQLLLYRAQDRVIDLGQSALKRADQVSSKVVEWDVDETLRAQIAAVFVREDLDDDQKLISVFELWTKSPPVKNIVSRFLLRGAGRDALAQRSIYARTVGKWFARRLGPHYNPVSNRTVGFSSAKTGANAVDVTFAFHEWTHAAHRNSSPLLWILFIKARSFEFTQALVRTPMTPVGRRQQEVIAMGSQWELMQVIPRDVRGRLLARAETYERGEPSFEERRLINAVYGAGLVQRFQQLGLSVINADAVNKGEALTARDAFELTFLHAMTGTAKRAWYKIFRARAKGILGEDDMKFVRSIMRQGRDAPEVRAALESHGAIEFEGQEARGAAESVLANARYPGRIGYDLHEAYLETLRHADLPKDEFVRRLSFTHGYTMDSLVRDHYNSKLRTMFLAGTAWMFALGTINYAPAIDVDLLIRLSKWWLGN